MAVVGFSFMTFTTPDLGNVKMPCYIVSETAEDFNVSSQVSISISQIEGTILAYKNLSDPAVSPIIDGSVAVRDHPEFTWELSSSGYIVTLNDSNYTPGSFSLTWRINKRASYTTTLNTSFPAVVRTSDGVYFPARMSGTIVNAYLTVTGISSTSFGYYKYEASGISISVFGSDNSSYVPLINTIRDLMLLCHEEVISTDPYNEGGNSGTGGGTGNFDGTGDLISVPSLPTLAASDTGFITLYNPSISQLKNLAHYMWSNPLFDIDGWKKIFADPMQAILGLSIVPVAVPSGGSQVITVGNISTDVSMTVAASQYVEVDCGTLNVNEFWGAYLDYDPYTQCEIYLPYCGIHPLSVDDIMGKSVHVVYHIDILSGAATAFVSCGGTVLYSFVGQCASSIPITGDNWTNVINGAINIAASIGSMIASDGMTAPMAAASIASTAVNQMKPRVEKSGSMGGTGGMLAVQTPYLILTRPQQCLPMDQNTYTGYPSFISENLSSLEGYTEIELIHLEGISATSSEINELESILKGGVIF